MPTLAQCHKEALKMKRDKKGRFASYKIISNEDKIKSALNRITKAERQLVKSRRDIKSINPNSGYTLSDIEYAFLTGMDRASIKKSTREKLAAYISSLKTKE